MNNERLLITTCVTLGSGGMAAIFYNLYKGDDDYSKLNKDNNCDDNNCEDNNCEDNNCDDNCDDNNSNDTVIQKRYKCPFASGLGVGITVGTIGGVLTWIFYK